LIDVTTGFATESKRLLSENAERATVIGAVTLPASTPMPNHYGAMNRQRIMLVWAKPTPEEFLQ
jgi:hypothetical protein